MPISQLTSVYALNKTQNVDPGITGDPGHCFVFYPQLNMSPVRYSLSRSRHFIFLSRTGATNLPRSHVKCKPTCKLSQNRH
jgi:hypothetical protein